MICLPINFFDYHSRYFIPLLYFVLPFPFFALNIDIAHTYLAPGDGLYQGVPAFLYHSEWSLWLPYVAGGIPFAADPQNQAFYLPALLFSSLLPNALGYNLLLLSHYSLMGLGGYLFLRSFPLKKLAAIAGGIMMMFSGFMAAHKGHYAMVEAAAWLPWLLLALRHSILLGQRVYVVLAGLAWGMMFLAGYPAIALYSAMIVVPYVVFLSLSLSKNIRSGLTALLVCGGCFILGLLFASPQLLSIYEAMPLLSRQEIDYSFFSSYSFEWTTLPLWFFPYFFGSQGDLFYASPYVGLWNLTELTGYMGVFPTLLALFSFYALRKTNKEVWFWGVVAFLGFFLVMGDATPLYKLMYELPVYNMFRAPARNWFEVDFAIAVLAAISLNALLGMTRVSFASILKKLFLLAIAYLFLAIGSVLVWHLLQPSMLHELSFVWLIEKGFLPSYWVPLSLMLLLIFMLFFVLRKQLYSKNAVVLFTAFILLDLFSFGFFHDYRYADADSLKAEPGIRKAMSADTMMYRILPVHGFGQGLYPNLNVSSGYLAANGYGPIWLSNYIQATGLSTNGLPLPDSSLLNNDCLLSALSIKYIHSKQPIDTLSSQWLLSTVTDSGFYIYRNKHVLPRMRLVAQQERVEANPVSCEPSLEGSVGVDAFSIQWENDQISAQFETRDDNILLILADTLFSGWFVRLDGEEVTLQSVGGLFRGAIIPKAGKHTVVFSYIPYLAYLGVVISILVLLFGLILIYMHKRSQSFVKDVFAPPFSAKISRYESLISAHSVNDSSKLNDGQKELWDTLIKKFKK